MAGAEAKVLSALPPDLRDSAARMRSRFHLDAPAWFAEAEPPDHLAAVASAIWRQRRLAIRYRSWKGERERVVEPLGLVLKGGAWYLVARAEASLRTYRAARILELEEGAEGFERPEGFDLAAHWRQAAERMQEELKGARAQVRLSALGVRLLGMLSSPCVKAGTVLGERDARGWRIAELPAGRWQEALAALLPLGAEVEVLAPPELRARMAETTQAMAKLHNRKQDRRERQTTNSEGKLPVR